MRFAWWAFLAAGALAIDFAAVVAILRWLPPFDWWGEHRNSVQAIVLPLSALGALFALGFAGWRSFSLHQQSQTDRDRQVTDSLGRAVELLGHENRSVRLGAIYALERIARQNREEHWPIMETLTASVRDWSRTRSVEADARSALADLISDGKSTSTEPPKPPPAPVDIQAILAVLARRNVAHEHPLPAPGKQPGRKLHLEDAYLVGARLEPGGDLRWARLERARLDYSTLKEVDLSGANLWDAHLTHANLQGARLEQEAFLQQARLEHANLSEAHMMKAKLAGAFMSRAFCVKADLRDADLHQAELYSTNFQSAKLQGAELRGIGLIKGQLKLANGDSRTKTEDDVRPDHWPPQEED